MRMDRYLVTSAPMGNGAAFMLLPARASGGREGVFSAGHVPIAYHSDAGNAPQEGALLRQKREVDRYAAPFTIEAYYVDSAPRGAAGNGEGLLSLLGRVDVAATSVLVET